MSEAVGSTFAIGPVSSACHGGERSTDCGTNTRRRRRPARKLELAWAAELGFLGADKLEPEACCGSTRERNLTAKIGAFSRPLRDHRQWYAKPKHQKFRQRRAECSCDARIEVRQSSCCA